MNLWGYSVYGEPCRDCNYRWSTSADAAVELVAGVPTAYRAALGGSDGTARHPDLGWTATGYVCHVVDNLRIWAERLAGAAAGGSSVIAPYETDLLATARSYNAVPLAGALWSLENSARDWLGAVAAAQRAGVVLLHPERGAMPADDVAVHNAHDAFHHQWDISRTLKAPARTE